MILSLVAHRHLATPRLSGWTNFQAPDCRTDTTEGSSHVELITETAVDCTGRATHWLYLRLDGTVEIIDAHGNRAPVDPSRRVCLTPGVSVVPHVMDIAVAMGAVELR
jgi:hypothetical protein